MEDRKLLVRNILETKTAAVGFDGYARPFSFVFLCGWMAHKLRKPSLPPRPL